jgi:hypothetical protein
VSTRRLTDPGVKSPRFAVYSYDLYDSYACGAPYAHGSRAGVPYAL